MENKLSPQITEILNFGKEEAVRLHSPVVEPEHLLLAMMREESCTATAILRNLGVDFLAMRQRLESAVVKGALQKDPLLSDAASRIIKLMLLEARAMQAEWADTEHLLLAMLRNGEESVCRQLTEAGVDYQQVKNALTQKQDPQAGFGYTDEDEDDDDDEEDLHDSGRPGQQGSQAQAAGTRKGKGSGTPALDTFGTDLTKAAEEGVLDPIVGREREIERVAQ
ncbi:MAG: ATP-dependent Clp protease ATP-binding subunit, partial [Bacteroidaceae bacterium]|nr:ATP-dependent Clp protease ATP-binding subunit [Bacteroidaceae bacterium]